MAQEKMRVMSYPAFFCLFLYRLNALVAFEISLSCCVPPSDMKLSILIPDLIYNV